MNKEQKNLIYAWVDGLFGGLPLGALAITIVYSSGFPIDLTMLGGLIIIISLLTLWLKLKELKRGGKN